MSGEYEVGYGKPPVSNRYQKGDTGNPYGRPKEHHLRFDPGVILQSIESEKVLVRANGKRKQMSKAEIEFRQLFNSAARGDMEAAKTILNMAKRYFVLEIEGEVDPDPLFMTEEQAARWQRNRRRRRSVRLVSRSLLFRKIAQEQVTIEIEGCKRKRSIFEAMLRQISTMALNKDTAASKLLEVARKQFPGVRAGGAPLIFIVSESDLAL